MKSMNDSIYDTMLREERGFSSREIMARFFRMSNVDERRAERIVSPILMNDARFTRDEISLRWRAVRIRDAGRFGCFFRTFLHRGYISRTER